MPHESPEKNPLSRFVLFMLSLALAASLVAGAWVYAVELPAQAAVQPPSNAYFGGGEPGDGPGGAGALTCGPHYDNNGNLIGYTCCDRNGNPVSCTTHLDLI